MEDAALYVSSNGMQKRDALIVLSEYLPNMSWQNQGETVLDVGCGSGDVTRNLLLPLLPGGGVERVVGVDVSGDMISYASKKYQHNALSFTLLDIERTIQPRQVFPDGFTKVFSLYCLHWIKDQERCLSNIYQLLQPGGEALLVFLAKNPLFTMYENISMMEKWAPYMQDVSNYISVYQHKADPVRAMTELAEDLGYEVVSCEAPQLEYVFKNINYAKNAIAAVNPFLKRIPPGPLQEEYLRECLSQLALLKTTNPDGTMVARYNLMVAHLCRPEGRC